MALRRLLASTKFHLRRACPAQPAARLSFLSQRVPLQNIHHRLNVYWVSPFSRILGRDGGKTARLCSTSSDSDYSDEAEQEKGYISNTLVTAEWARHHYLLEDCHLKELKVMKPARSAYTSGQREDMYNVTQVQAKAIEVWGNLRKIHELQLQRQAMLDEEAQRQQQIEIIAKKGERKKTKGEKKWDPVQAASEKVVWRACLGNILVCSLKLAAFLYTSSISMLAETIHSIFDAAHQAVLLFGIKKSRALPSWDHPYGQSRAIYASGLICGVNLFLLGGILPIYQGGSALWFGGHEVTNLVVAVSVSLFSAGVEAWTFRGAWRQVRLLATQSRVSLRHYIKHGSDSNVIHVLIEDGVAILGIGTAAIALLLDFFFGQKIFDACGGIIIGAIMTGSASMLVRRNYRSVVGVTAEPHLVNNITDTLQGMRAVHSVHDSKATMIGANKMMFKSELFFDGAEIAETSLVRRKVTPQMLMKEMNSVKTPAEAQNLFKKYSSNIVNELGETTDEIEKKLKKKFPQLRHVDLEVL